MPYRFLDIDEVARFLGLDRRKVERLAQRGGIPCQKVEGKFRFNRAQLTEWLQQRMVSHPHDHHDTMDASLIEHREVHPEDLLITPLLDSRAIEMHLEAKTAPSVLRGLVNLAQRTDKLYDPDTLLEELQQREELCSTALEDGIAIPHPRRPQPYIVAEPILVIAHSHRGIGFGAPDGRLTDLFFLTCSEDDHHHLHILARLSRLLHQTDLTGRLRAAPEPAAVLEHVRELEIDLIAGG